MATADRYEPGPLLGRGAMGEVHCSFDHRLQRDVARKTAADPSQLRRLAREAVITARLEHPGIVAVYDAGTDADGTPWYTMRLVRGKTLAAAMVDSDGATLSELLRHLLAASQAVAFAHSRRVIHRDLKPENILVGAFGETQVADWGLAVSLDEEAGGIEGTLAYMSPEQRRGAPASPASDVWALGVVLRELIEAKPEGQVLPPGGEIDTIVRRSTAEDPLVRYPDAAALADDLGRFLDGRRVLAHRYSALDLLGRLVRLWRAPLTVAAVAAVALVVLAVGTWIRTDRERARAVLAESIAARAGERAVTNLSLAQSARARTSEAEGDRAGAERLALFALESRESPAARGVLVGVDAGARPERTERGRGPRCERGAFGHPGILCVAGNDAWGMDDTGRVLWRTGLEGPGMAAPLPDGRALAWTLGGPLLFLDDDGTVLAQLRLPPDFYPQWVAAGPDGRALIGRADRWLLYDLRGETFQSVQPCRSGAGGSSPLWLDRLYLLCADGEIAVAAPTDAQTFDHRPLPVEVTRGLSRLAAWDGDSLVITTDGGRVALIDRSTLAVRSASQITNHPLVEIAGSSKAGFVALRGDRGDVHIWWPATGETLVLPGQAVAIAVEGDQLLVLGESIGSWRFPPSAPARSVPLGAGASALVLRPDGAEAVACRGDGFVSVWDLRSATAREFSIRSGVVIKDGSYGVDGSFVAALAGGPGERGVLVGLSAGFQPLWEGGALTARRIEALSNGAFLVLPWNEEGPSLFRPGVGHQSLGKTGRFHELGASPDRRRVVLADDERVLLAEVNDQGLSWREERAVTGARQVVVLDDGSVFHSQAGAVTRHDASGDLAMAAPMDSPTSLAVSPSGATIAAGDLRGTIFLWDRGGALLAELHAHDSRVSGLSFLGEDGLVSTSWDATMKRWSLLSLRKAPAQLRSELGPWAAAAD